MLDPRCFTEASAQEKEGLGEISSWIAKYFRQSDLSDSYSPEIVILICHASAAAGRSRRMPFKNKLLQATPPLDLPVWDALE